MASSPSNVPPDLVQFIIPLLVVGFTAILGLLRRLDRWLREHYSPRPGTRAGERPELAPGTPRPAPWRQVDEEEAEDPQAVLMRELERALGPERPRPAAPEAPRRAEGEPAPPARSPVIGPMAPPLAASVGRRQFGHLALLHSRADLRNAVVLTEILGQPACYRRLGWRFPR